MSRTTCALLAFGMISGLATETFADGSVPGGWDTQVGRQAFSETAQAAYPIVGRVGAYGYGVIPGSKSPFSRETTPADAFSPWLNSVESGMGATNTLLPLANTVRRTARNRRRGGR